AGDESTVAASARTQTCSHVSWIAVLAQINSPRSPPDVPLPRRTVMLVGAGAVAQQSGRLLLPPLQAKSAEVGALLAKLAWSIVRGRCGGDNGRGGGGVAVRHGSRVSVDSLGGAIAPVDAPGGNGVLGRNARREP